MIGSVIIDIINIFATVGAMVIVAHITNKAATDAYDKLREEKKIEYQAQVHMILKEIGYRLDVLRRVDKEIDKLINNTLGNLNQSSVDGFRFVHSIYTLLRRIKPDGGFNYFYEFEILFAMENLNGELCYRVGGEKIKNLEELENEIEIIKEKLDEINELLQLIYRNVQNPYLFFTTINPNDDKKIVGQIYEKILEGTSIYNLYDDMKLIEFISSESLKKPFSKFDEKLSECEGFIEESKIFPDAVKKKYFKIH